MPSLGSQVWSVADQFVLAVGTVTCPEGETVAVDVLGGETARSSARVGDASGTEGSPAGVLVSTGGLLGPGGGTSG